MLRFSSIIVLLFVLLFLSCSNSPNEKFLGKWQFVGDESSQLTITKSGEGFLITLLWGDKDKTPAFYRDGFLFGTIKGMDLKFSYIEESDRLSATYVKDPEREPFELERIM